METWIDVLLTIATIAVAIIAVIYSRASLKRTEEGLYADILLRLDEAMKDHREVHAKLRPGGDWARADGPTTNREWIDVEAYMGLFERVNFLHEQNLISLDYIRRFYGYRYANIYCNPVINEEKLVKRRAGWRDFMALGEKLDVPQRYERALDQRRMARQREDRP